MDTDNLKKVRRNFPCKSKNSSNSFKFTSPIPKRRNYAHIKSFSKKMVTATTRYDQKAVSQVAAKKILLLSYPRDGLAPKIPNTRQADLRTSRLSRD